MRCIEAALLLAVTTSGCGRSSSPTEAENASAAQVLATLASGVRQHLTGRWDAGPDMMDGRWLLPESAAPRIIPATAVSASPPPSDLPDGSLIARHQLAEISGVALELIAYVSDGLVVGGVLCYPNDGSRHSTVIHVHGGLGGIFDDPSGSMVQACIDWATKHGRTAFAPSLRGQDGGEGRAEMCLGEANDVAAAALLLRSLDVVDPDRVGLVGGSIGGCVVLRAAAKIPDLSAIVAFVPPIDWEGFMTFHRSSFTPASEILCDGSVKDWNVGGPELADTFDTIICGHPFCNVEEYEKRSPLPGIAAVTAPTLVVSAEFDNIVPVQQQILWPLLRSQTGHALSIYVVDPCDPPGDLDSDGDVLLHVLSTFHGLSRSTISTGLLFLMSRLDGSEL